MLRFFFGRIVTFQSLYNLRSHVIWTHSFFTRNLLFVLPTAYADKLHLISVLDFYYLVLEMLPEYGTLVLKHVRSSILVMNSIFLSACVDWCTGCKDMQLYD